MGRLGCDRPLNSFTGDFRMSHLHASGERGGISIVKDPRGWLCWMRMLTELSTLFVLFPFLRELGKYLAGRIQLMNRKEVTVLLIGLQASELYEERPSEHNLTFFSLQSLHKYPVHFNDFTR